MFNSALSLGGKAVSKVASLATADLSEAPVIGRVAKAIPGFKSAKGTRDSMLKTGRALAMAALLNPATPYVAAVTGTLGVGSYMINEASKVEEPDTRQEVALKIIKQLNRNPKSAIAPEDYAHVLRRQGLIYGGATQMHLNRRVKTLFQDMESSNLSLDEKLRIVADRLIERIEEEEEGDTSRQKEISRDALARLTNIKDWLKGFPEYEKENKLRDAVKQLGNHNLPEAMPSFDTYDSATSELVFELKRIIHANKKATLDEFIKKNLSESNVRAAMALANYQLSYNPETKMGNEVLLQEYYPNVKEYLDNGGDRKAYQELLDFVKSKIDVRINVDPEFNANQDSARRFKGGYESQEAPNDMQTLIANRLINTFIYKPEILYKALGNTDDPITYIVDPISDEYENLNSDKAAMGLFYVRHNMALNQKLHLAIPLKLTTLNSSLKILDHENLHLVDFLLGKLFSIKPERYGEDEFVALRKEAKAILAQRCQDDDCEDIYRYAHLGQNNKENDSSAKYEFFAVMGADKFLHESRDFKRQFPELYSWFSQFTGLDPVAKGKQRPRYEYAQVFSPDAGLVIQGERSRQFVGPRKPKNDPVEKRFSPSNAKKADQQIARNGGDFRKATRQKDYRVKAALARQAALRH